MNNRSASTPRVAKPPLSTAVSCQAMRYTFGEDLENGLPDSVADTYRKFARYGPEGALPPASAADGKMKTEKQLSDAPRSAVPEVFCRSPAVLS